MTFNCNEMLGGAAQLDFYLLSETSNWPTVVTDQNSAQLVITAETVEVDAALSDDSIRALYNMSRSDAGSTFAIDLQMQFVTRSEALEQLLEQYENQPGIAILKLNNDFQKLIGTNLQPLYLTYGVADGTSVDDNSAGTNVRIRGQQRTRPVYYTPSV